MVTSASSPARAPERLLSIQDHQKGFLEHQEQTLTATRQQLREQAVSLQLNEESVQPSAQAPEDSKAGFERILLIEEECIRWVSSWHEPERQSEQELGCLNLNVRRARRFLISRIKNSITFKS
jgi:hypothetical protein